MKKDKKIKVLEELKEKLGKAKSFVLADYRGLTHQQLEEIKKGLRQAQAELLVTKNTLLRLALGKKEEIESHLAGPTVVLFSYEDGIAPLGVLAKFIKTFGLPQIKIGVLDNKILSSEEILHLASLPSREVLMGTLIARLKSPLFRTHYALNWNLYKLSLILKGVKKDG